MSDIDTSLALSTDRRDIQQTSLNHALIADAINRSQDSGSTLQFSRLNISDVGVEAAEQLATIGRRDPDDHGIVQRLALDHNRLATLPMEFALLSRLRYLNLKHNNFSIFPNVLTLMPSLDTLDISHNKIKRLPTQPGRLVQLRVFCLSRNKLSRLPNYLSQFRCLEVFHVDRNPVEWPPNTPMADYNLDDSTSMKAWIRSLQSSLATGVKLADDGYDISRGTETDIAEQYNEWRFPFRKLDSDIEAIPHSRTLSVDSTSSIPESLQAVAISKSTRASADRPPPLRLGMLHSTSDDSSPPASFDGNFSSPADSDVFETEREHGNASALHSRTTSEIGGLTQLGQKASMNHKKSLPDLRTVQNHNFDKVVGSEDLTKQPLPPPQRENTESSHSPSLRFNFQEGSSPVVPRASHSLGHHTSTSSTRNLPSMSFERNSYFHRLSSFPAIAFPMPLSCLIESARTILFVLCQVYNAIEHYAIHAIDERLASVLRKVLDPANADMLRLIRSLDRFDSTSRKTLPSSIICRDVMESCRDTVTAFIKALGVLTLQVQVISASDDVRFTRWITLELYAAMAEISYSWQSVLPHIDAIKQLLQTTRFQHASGSVSSEAQNTHTYTEDDVHDSDISTRHTLRVRAADNRTQGGVSIGRARTTRRHAGSFSSKDVEIGKTLPSYEEVNVVSGIVSPSFHPPKRVLTPLSSTQSVTPTGYAALLDNFDRNHSHSASLSSSHPHSNSSPSVPFSSGVVDLPKHRNRVDKETLQAISNAIEIAPSTWDLIEETFGGYSENGGNTIQQLQDARNITRKLSDHIRTATDSDSYVDRKALHDDAHSFLKVVVQLSGMVKTHGEEREIPPTLNTQMEKLTNSTEQFAMLLHVSSFTLNVSRPQSPMYNSHLLSDDVLLGSSLPRIPRNNHGSSSGMPRFPPDGPRSALPTQSFKIPTTLRRLRSAREARMHSGDPG